MQIVTGSIVDRPSVECFYLANNSKSTCTSTHGMKSSSRLISYIPMYQYCIKHLWDGVNEYTYMWWFLQIWRNYLVSIGCLSCIKLLLAQGLLLLRIGAQRNLYLAHLLHVSILLLCILRNTVTVLRNSSIIVLG